LPHVRSSRTVLVASCAFSMPHVGSFGAALKTAEAQVTRDPVPSPPPVFAMVPLDARRFARVRGS
jgi:hypothetical protein